MVMNSLFLLEGKQKGLNIVKTIDIAYYSDLG